MKIPVAEPSLNGNEEAYVVDAIRSSWISSSGAYLDSFQNDFAKLCGTKHAIAVSNGTVALHLALLGLGVGPGDEVIVPSLTYVASVNAVTYVGAKPVFADVDPETWCLSVSDVVDKITSRTKAVVVVHLYGQPADMAELVATCSARGIRVVEDAAEAFLATYRGAPVGGLADVATFSFYGNKLITSGEGGAVTLNDDALARRLRSLRGQGMDPNRRYWFPVVGYNYRLTNVAAALLCAQLERRNEFLEKRNAIYELYMTILSEIPGIALQASLPDRIKSPWLFSILVDKESFGITRDGLARHLEDSGIETRPFFPPVHRLPPYAELGKSFKLDVTDRLSAQGLNLPTYVDLELTSVQRVCEQIINAGGKRT
jgi:perosamine synthetase